MEPTIEDSRLQAEFGRLHMTKEFWKTLSSLTPHKPREWRICAQYAFVKESARTVQEQPRQTLQTRNFASITDTTPMTGTIISTAPLTESPTLDTTTEAEIVTPAEHRMQQNFVEASMRMSMLEQPEKEKIFGEMVDETEDLPTPLLMDHQKDIYATLSSVPIQKEKLSRNIQLLIDHYHTDQKVTEEEIVTATVEAIRRIESSIHTSPGIKGITGERVLYAGNVYGALYAAAITSTPNLSGLPQALQESLGSINMQETYESLDHEGRSTLLKKAMFIQPNLRPHIVAAFANSLKKPVTPSKPPVSPQMPGGIPKKSRLGSRPKTIASQPPQQPSQPEGYEMDQTAESENVKRRTTSGGKSIIKSGKRLIWLTAGAGVVGAGGFLATIFGFSHANSQNAAKTSLHILHMFASHIFSLIS